MSHELVLEIYKSTRDFPETEKFGITSQMRRAAYSIPANIAEGSARSSDKEFRQFLFVSYGSTTELEYFILLSHDLKYLSSDLFEMHQSKVTSLKKSLNKLISTLSE